ncbi:hypothetical protein HAHE_15590 [Haloferula helveola]|uniref:PD(D/E)XK endonuclease domain-containing protein n=1 Tax=Haloferula helveola TaxID=490095 RepID=A0ABM7RKR5_9BACT|nr:hypothetical protein HAHE_15590 [Haloferula helveola]
MPNRLTQTPPGTHQALKNTAFEILAVSWLMHDGWQVFLPILDHGHKTDILISDGPKYFRIQIKTVEARSDDHVVRNQWSESHVDYVVFFVRNSNWGVIAPAFEEAERPLNHQSHRRFNQTKNEFLKEFHKV